MRFDISVEGSSQAPIGIGNWTSSPRTSATSWRLRTRESSEQTRQVAIVEKALQQSVQDNLSDLQTRLDRQHEDQAKGKDMGIAIRTTNDAIDVLTSELRVRRAALARRKVTAIQTPHVVGVV